MDKGIYTALSGGLAKQREIELIATNLANANTPGFKRDTATFNEYLTQLRRPDSVGSLPREIQAAADPSLRPQSDKSFVEVDAVYTDFRQGTVRKSGNPLDVAISGDGLLEVLTPSGVRYTRAGNLKMDGAGRLVNASGFPVLFEDAKRVSGLPIPEEDLTAPESRMIQLAQGPVEITPDRRILQQGLEVAKLSVVDFHETQYLEKVGNSLFRNTHPDNLKRSPSQAKLHQGFLETSNVNAVHEMTRLIQATRAYESHMQAIKTYSEIDGRSVNDIARR